VQATLIITRYKSWAVPFAFLSMAIFRLPLYLNKKLNFYKLLGSGKNGSFDKIPDLHQWAILCGYKDDITLKNNSFPQQILGKFICTWFKLFAVETFTISLEPIAGHGLWDKKEVFGQFEKNITYEGPVATLTRATIRLSKLKYFWEHVAPITLKMNTAKGYVFSIGIGEIPWIKQATFSIWESVDDMKVFAYGMREHSEVIKKTRQQQWYSEDMFVRFKITGSTGTIKGTNPLKRIL
jgi:hypothetical protein